MNKLPIPYLPIIIVLAILLTLTGIVGHDVQEWDEARNGVNAYEMYHNKDYINLYYDDELDTWNAKPPLLTWLIVFSYHIFGFNEFALRFPSLVATIFFFTYLFLLIRLYDTQKTAFLSCFILLCCKAVVGPHVGITGDFDALMLFFLTAMVYYLMRYLEFGLKQHIYLAAISFGLAFYAKGFASFVIFPGMALFLVLTGNLLPVLKRREFWLASIIGLLFIASWLTTISIWGKYPSDNHYHNSGIIETMLVNDIYERLATTTFDYKDPNKEFRPDRTFIVSTLDAHFNLWNYIFWLGLATILVIMYRRRQSIGSPARNGSHRLLLLSVSLIAPFALVLTFATYKHFWYLAPVYGYIAYITAWTVIYYSQRWKKIVFIAYVLATFTFVRHVFYLYNRPGELRRFMSRNNVYFKNQNQIAVTGHVGQDVLLYTKWLGKNITKVNCNEKISHKDNPVFISQATCMVNQPGITCTAMYKNYFIATYLAE